MNRTRTQVSLTRVNKRIIIYVLVLVFAVVLRLINIDVPLMNQAHDFRQSQTAIVVQRFFIDGFDPIHYQIPVFGEPWSLPFEFPIYQMLLYLIMSLLGFVDITICGRLFSIVVFMISSVILHVLVKELTNERIADVSALVYLFSPYDLFWSRALLIDYLSVLFALVYVLLFFYYLKKGKFIYVVTGVLFGVLAYLQKASTMFPYVVFLTLIIIDGMISIYRLSTEKQFFKWLINDVKSKLSGYICIVILAVVPVIPVVFWDRYADGIKSNGNCFYRSLLSDNLTNWYYGTIEQRLNLSEWSRILQFICSLCGGTMVLLILLATYIAVKEKKYLKIFLFAAVSCFSAPLILFNLYAIHSYYYIAITPVFSLLVGIALYEVVSAIWCRRLLAGIFVTAICMWVFQSPYIKDTYYSYDFFDRGIYLIEQLTTDEDQIIYAEGDWNPRVFYTIERKGLMLYHYDGYSFDTVYEEVISKNRDDYSYLCGYIMEDIIPVINVYPNNIHLFSYPYFGAKLYSDESFPVSAIEEYEWNSFDNTLNTDDEQLIRFDRNGDRNCSLYPVQIVTDDLILDTVIIFSDDSDYAYLSTKGISGIINITFEDADIITMSSVDFNIT